MKLRTCSAFERFLPCISNFFAIFLGCTIKEYCHYNIEFEIKEVLNIKCETCIYFSKTRYGLIIGRLIFKLFHYMHKAKMCEGCNHSKCFLTLVLLQNHKPRFQLWVRSRFIFTYKNPITFSNCRQLLKTSAFKYLE